MGKKITNCLLMLCFAVAPQVTANYITNPGFETGDFAGWTEWGEGEVYIVTDAYEGSYAASLTDDEGIIQYGISLPFADSYTLAFQVKGDINTGQFYYILSNSSDYTDIFRDAFTVTSEWTQIIVPFTVSVPKNVYLSIWGNDGGASGNVIVDDFLLICGEIGPSLEAEYPDPYDGQINVSLDADLSWSTGDDPNITEVYSFDVYVDPNILKVQAKDGDCLYVSMGRGPTETTYDPNPLGDNFDPETTYYWSVDTQLELNNSGEPVFVPGVVWTFSTLIPFDRPKAGAGENLLGTVAMGLAGIQLNGTVTDPDDNIINIEWSVDQKPQVAAVHFTDASDPATTVTVDTEGLYVLKLLAEDEEEQIGQDKMEILVYDDACEAAQNNPDGYTPIDSDTDSDCEIDTEDFSTVSSEWLEVNHLSEYGGYEEDIVITNLLINPGFEMGDFTGWLYWDEVYFSTVVTGEQRSGKYCARISDGEGGFAQGFPVTPGKKYSFSFWYKGDLKSSKWWWGIRTPDRTDIVWGSVADWPDDYQQITATFTAPDNYDHSELWFWSNDNRPSYVDDCEIVELVSEEPVEVDISIAHNPQPANETEDVAVDNLTLSFNAAADPNTLIPNPDITAHYLYFSNDANLPGPRIELAVDVNPADGNVDPTASYTLAETLLKDEVYYWRVDERLQNDANVITGDVWSFTTETEGLIVNAGLNWIAWLDPNLATIQLDASVTSQTTEISSISWSVYEKPGFSTVVFSPDENVEDPLVTVDTTGRYLLTLSAQDNTGDAEEDLMAIDVYADVCEATLNHPEHPQLASDFTSDCHVNLDDLTVLIEEWMEFNYLTETATYEDDIHIDINGYMVNGGFETGDTTGWYATTGMVTITDPFEGFYGFEMDDMGGIFYDVELKAGSYLLTFWTRGDISSGTFTMGIADAWEPSFPVTSVWTQVEVPFSVGEDGIETLWLWGNNKPSTTGTCVVDDFWLVEQE